MAEEEKTLAPPHNILDELRIKGINLRIHLADGSAVEGIIESIDRYNLLVKRDDAKQYWIPKHSVVYAETL